MAASSDHRHDALGDRWGDGPVFEVQTARVYRVLGRRFLTKHGALAFYARTRYRQRARSGCDCARYWSTCDCPRNEAAVVRRYVRFLTRWTATARPARAPRVQRGIRLREPEGDAPCPLTASGC